MKLWGASTDKVDLSTGVCAVLTPEGRSVTFPGANHFEVDGDGELTVTMGGGPVAVVARGAWVYVFYVFEAGKSTATAVSDPD